jgi:hypothetical protein
MPIGFTEAQAKDADQLTRRWGTTVAIEMLVEGLISPEDFVGLCAEALSAVDR